MFHLFHHLLQSVSLYKRLILPPLSLLPATLPPLLPLQESHLVAGVAFKKTFSYAGFEMQPKRYDQPKIALLNVELELKAEKDNAEVRVKSVEVSNQSI